MSGDWVFMRHRESGGTARFPAGEGVADWYTARGWVVEDEPADQPFVPPKVVQASEDDGWVTLYHSETGASHVFPSHPDAVQGAYDAGWHATPPKPDPADAGPAGDDSDAPTRRRSAKTKASSTPATNEEE